MDEGASVDSIMKHWPSSPSLFIFVSLLIIGIQEISGSEHRTKAATEKLADLWCYKCDTMVDDKCQSLHDNSSLLHTKCNNDQRICKVKRISMSTSTEDVTGKPKLWLLQRNCSKSCEPGCIVIGERTKLYSCTTCCESNFCNSGSGSENWMARSVHATLFLNLFGLLTKRLLS